MEKSSKIKSKQPMIKQFRSDDPNTYPLKQKIILNDWDEILDAAKDKANKGDFKALNQVKKLLREEYKNSGGDWISTEEKKLANINQSIPSEINFNEFSDITKSRIFLEKLRNRNIEVGKNKESLKKKYLEGIPSILSVNE